MNKNQTMALTRLTAKDVRFEIVNGLPSMTLEKDGETKHFRRVILQRNFPFDLSFEYISVLDEEQDEIGIIYDLDGFDEHQTMLIKTELERKYYQPHVKTILSLKERYGFSYWKIVTSEDRELSFTMQDTFKNIIRVGADKAILLDVDGNRFVIESLEALDRKSYRKIELYL